MGTCVLNSITTVTTTLGFSFTDILMLIIFFCGIVFCARDFRVGLIVWEVLYSLQFLWFYNAVKFHSCTGYDWVKPLVAVIVCFALMALTLLPTKQSAQVPGGYA